MFTPENCICSANYTEQQDISVSLTMQNYYFLFGYYDFISNIVALLTKEATSNWHNNHTPLA
jgi:hypothetical protein